MTRSAIGAGMAGLGLVAFLSFGALADPAITPDLAAKQWLTIVDGGDYAESWDHAGTPFKTRITVKDWQAKFAPVRNPLGAIITRKLIDVKLSTTLPTLPDGNYATVQFNSSFANKATAVETVAVELEGDHWAVIGYFIR